MPRVISILLVLACACRPDTGTTGQDTGCTVSSWYADLDGDGYGAGAATEACLRPDGMVADDGDCDDGNDAVHPGADEVCNGVDDDCDRVADPESEVGRVDCYADEDGDGAGDPEAWVSDCACPDGTVANATDCDDGDGDVHPGAAEAWYDGIDQDCAGDDDFDADGDGYLHGADDCDDADPAVNPAAEELCGNGLDDDCDGSPGDCGLVGDVSSEDATTTVLDASDATAWSVGTSAADVNGDGLPELLLARHDAPGGEAGLLDYVLLPLDLPGVATVDERAAVRLQLATGDESWETVSILSSRGDLDVDGDGYPDLLLGAENAATAARRAPSRVFLVHGPVSDDVDLDTVPVALAAGTDELLGSRGIGLTESADSGARVVAAGVHVVDSRGWDPVVRLIDQDCFLERCSISDAPAIWTGDDEVIAASGGLLGGDIDEDGIGDIVLVTQDASTGAEFRSLVFIGPVSDDLTTSDADAEIRDDPVGADIARVSALCGGPGGGTRLASSASHDGPAGESSSSFRFYDWAGPGVHDEGDAASEVVQAGVGAVAACGGDLDGNGTGEVFVPQDVADDDVALETTQASLFEAPVTGVWELNTLAGATLRVPDTLDPGIMALDALLGTDFDGDGLSDLVYTTRIDPGHDGLSRRMVLYRYAGEATGL